VTKIVISRFDTFIRTRGRVSAAADMKAARLAITRYISGRPLRGKVGTTISKKTGLPAILPAQAVHLLRERDPNFIKFILTVFSVSRHLRGGSPIDTSAITSPSTSSSEPTDFEIIQALKHLKVPLSATRPTGKTNPFR
jgi:hypothetical protein